MDKKYEPSSSEEMDRRKEKTEEFFRALLEVHERPYLVSDETTLDDIFLGDEEELNNRCEEYYGVRLQVPDFKIPLWRLLDQLAVRRRS